MPTSSATREFAEAPSAYLAPSLGATVVDEHRFHAAVSSDGTWIGVSRLRLEADEVGRVVEEIASFAPDACTTWVIGPSATPHDIVRRLSEAGCRPPDPPNEPTVTALAAESEPLTLERVDIRPIETFAQFLTGLEIVLASSSYPADAAARERADAPKTYARRLTRAGGEWLAYLNGTAVAYGGVIAGPRGLYLAGAATLPHARGRGCYRALIRARWDDAVRRGTPALVVHAQETSRPILEAVGFERVCTIHELESGRP